MSLQTIITRQKIIDSTRQFFKKKHFQEVDIPLLSSSLPTEQNLYSFNTKIEENKDILYLQLSPESALKKLLAAGIGNCFCLAKCFRNLESTGIYHNYEFLMLEWYQTAVTYQEVASKTHKLINHINRGLGIKKVQRVNFTLKQLFQNFADINLDNYLAAPDFSEADFNQLFLNKIEPQLPKDKLVFIFDYPALLSPLATPIAATPYAQRFEVYLHGVEIGNGNTENINATTIKSAMEAEQAYRLKNKLPTHPIDYDFIAACGQLPPCSGIGLGIDRLAMILTHANTIKDTIWL